jgi:hypothetical protein
MKIDAGSVSDLIWSFFSSPTFLFFNGVPMGLPPTNDNEN